MLQRNMTDIRIPPIGNGLDDVHLVEWLVSDASNVDVGQSIFSIESDKSVVEVSAPIAGKLRIMAGAGEMYRVGQVVGEID